MSHCQKCFWLIIICYQHSVKIGFSPSAWAIKELISCHLQVLSDTYLS